jgi:hypothetical protein
MPGVCPQRKIPDFLGPDLHPARPNDDVFPSAWPSWLSFTPATTPFNRDRGEFPTTFKGDSGKTSKKTQAPHTGRAPARPRTRVGGDVSPVGLSGPAIQCPGLTGAGRHRADKATGQRPRESHARRLSPTKDSRLPRPRSPSCPTQRRRFPLRMAVLAVVHASHHPLQPRSRGISNDVQGRLRENLQEDSGTTHGTSSGATRSMFSF